MSDTGDRTYVRHYARLPSYESLAAVTREKLAHTDRILRDLPPAVLAVEQLPSSSDRRFWSPMEHDLSFVFDTPQDASDALQVAAVRHERTVALASLDDFIDVMAEDDPSALLAFARRCCQRFGVPEDIRTGDIRTTSDRGGHVVFPPSPSLPERYADLFRFLRESPGGSPSFRSTVAMVLITNAHAFGDGNGRLSRLLFNVNQWREGIPRHTYFPWPVFFHRSKGGTLIRVRKAEIHGTWDDLLMQFCNGVANTIAFAGGEEITT